MLEHTPCPSSLCISNPRARTVPEMVSKIPPWALRCSPNRWLPSGGGKWQCAARPGRVLPIRLLTQASRSQLRAIASPVASSIVELSRNLEAQGPKSKVLANAGRFSVQGWQTWPTTPPIFSSFAKFARAWIQDRRLVHGRSYAYAAVRSCNLEAGGQSHFLVESRRNLYSKY